MKTKEEIVANWLPRYTKRKLEDFGEYILLTNFNKYVEIFAERFNVPILGRDANMTSAHAEGITIINFGMGSPNAAIIMDLLSAIHPKACLFLGKCGGIDRKNQIGDLILPIAAIRGEGTSNDYYPPERLLDRNRLYNQPAHLGTRRGVQEIPAKDKSHGSRYGNRYLIYYRLCQPYPDRSLTAGFRPAHDSGRCKDRAE